jgi:pimeloyl-ACP methyl ester carboxylesterase
VKRCGVGDIELEYEVAGVGEPVVFIPASLLADGFQPLLAEPPLAGHYRLIRYHRRSIAGGTPAQEPVSVADQAGDAAALLAHLGVKRAHVVGHSYGGLIALQLALDRPDIVASLCLLEPNLLAVPSAAAFNAEVRPAFAAYRAGDAADAVARFLAVVSGLPWEEYVQLIEQRVPGGVGQAIADADTFFTVEVPALAGWGFSADSATGIGCPVLSVQGAATHAFFRDGRLLLRRWFPNLEYADVPDGGHLLPLENPGGVAAALAEYFARHPIVAAKN